MGGSRTTTHSSALSTASNFAPAHPVPLLHLPHQPQALAGSSRITTLNLSPNCLTSCLCSLCPSATPQLRHLQALAGGSRITTLNLSSNNIGDAGAKALAEMLKASGVAVYDVCV